jgi:GNAT superfamily N-acetyltransferase
MRRTIIVARAGVPTGRRFPADSPVADFDNILWRSLSGSQRHLSVGTDRIRRYAPGFSGLIGFDDPRQPDWPALAPYCAPGEPLYCVGWSGPEPEGWAVNAQQTIVKMLWDGRLPDEDGGGEAAPAFTPLGPGDVAQAMALAALTRPGPFGPRTPELGDYLGCFEQGRLIAMAGERLWAGRYREVSAVCTHPDHQGRGLARRLTLAVLRRQLARSQQPFLHVMADNLAACGLYARMGFREVESDVVRVVARR